MTAKPAFQETRVITFPSLTLLHDRPVRFGALLAITLLATACGSTSEESGVHSSASSVEPTPSVSAEPVKEPYTVAIGGDVMFEGMLRQRLDADPTTAMGPVAEVFQEADVSVVNLETAITEGGTPAPAKQFVFRAPATAFTALKEAGVDVATVANNHGMDYGTEGSSTLSRTPRPRTSPSSGQAATSLRRTNPRSSKSMGTRWPSSAPPMYSTTTSSPIGLRARTSPG